ncbi:MAG: hypothetical protein FWG43_01970, partial [Clostridiales bacterium]|nr:hypothetical protein [Clostridiales bacterium]
MAATKNKLCRLFSYLVPIVLLALLLAGVTYGWQETQVANEFLGIHEEPTNKPKDNEKTPPQV